MSEDIKKLSIIGACLADIAATQAAIEAMKTQNDDNRSEGKDDAYCPKDFWDLADEMKKHAATLRDNA
jgi:hypothetical protein